MQTTFIVVAFTALFVVVEPFGVVPTFAALVHGRSREDIRRIALRASLVGAAILVLFALFGRLLLDTLSVRIDSFRMAGGLLLLFTAFDMLRAKQSSCRCTREEIDDASGKNDIAIVPIATPLLAGPGAMATVMMLMSRATESWMVGAVLASIAVTFLICYVVLRSAVLINRLAGRSTMAVLQRVLGLVLAAMALQFIVDGVLNLLKVASP